MAEGDGEESSGEEFGDLGEGTTDFAALINNPNFSAICDRIRQDPGFYNEFMANLQTQAPEIHNAIQANPMAFMNLVLGGDPGAGVSPSQEPV